MLYWLNNDERDIKIAYLAYKEKEEEKKNLPKFKADDLRDIGYTDVQIEEITRGQ